MYIIIGGAGDAGLHLGEILSKKGHEIAFIDNNINALNKAKNIDSLVIEGDVCDFRALLKAGIDNCDFYIGLVKNDSANLVSCSLANFYGSRTIARVRSTSLSKEPISRRYIPVGADIVLCPDLIVSHHISKIFSFPKKISKINNFKIASYRAVVEDDSNCNNKKLSDIKLPRGAKIVSVFRGVSQILPSKSFVFQSQDEICLFLDETVKIKNIKKILGCEISPFKLVKNVFIASATEIGINLAKKLIDSNISVFLMDISEKRSKLASQKLKNAKIIRADPLGHGVLKQEEIERFDVLFSVGHSLERNIFLSILAKKFNVPNAISLIDRIDLKESIEGTLVDSAIVPNLLLINSILNIIKSEKPLKKKSKRRLIKIKDLQTDEIILKEINVKRKHRCVDKKVRTLSPEIGNFLITMILKDDKGFIPNDNYNIKVGDTLFVLYHGSEEKALNRWFIG